MKKPVSDSLSNFAKSLDVSARASLTLECTLAKNSTQPDNPIIAGVDEAGRGPLAGPVVAAAVILDQNNIPAGLADSKLLSHKKREALFDQILQSSVVSFASLNAGEVDRINILQASLRAMEIAVVGLSQSPNYILVDGRDVPKGFAQKGHAIIKGDQLSMSIAAASIIAKVIRDRMMVRYSSLYPEYGFEKHKGYGSQLHREAIERHGPCPIHRLSFSPFKQKELL